MEIALAIPILILSFTVHEFAHAWVARREGDDTAARLGRVTLNPLPHLDLFGSILIPAMLIATRSGFLLGWAKPVPVDVRNLRRGRWSDLQVSLAGIMANLILALICTVVVVGLVHAARRFPDAGQVLETANTIAAAGIRLNFLLAVFNLLPVPPLDGSRVLYNLLPGRFAERFQRFERVGLLLFVVLMLTGALSVLLTPAIALERLSWTLIRWWT
jgi:Zn-dependent protease